MVVVLLAGGVTVVTTFVMTTGVDSVGSLVDLAAGVSITGSMMMPSHSLALAFGSAGSFDGSSVVVSEVSEVSEVVVFGDVLGVVSVAMSVVVSVAGDSERFSAKTDDEKLRILEIVATEPIKIRVKNNLTNLVIIIYYTILCSKRQEVV